MPTLLPAHPALEPLRALLARAAQRVERRLDEQLSSDLAPVQRLVQHVEKYRGKMVRPTMVILAGLAAASPAIDDPQDAHVSPAHITLAAVCELIHVATLVHDDVLDEAGTRRGARTVNSLHGNEAAVILGDYLFSAAYHLCSQLDDRDTSLRVARVGMTLCAGELLQDHHRGNFTLNEETYTSIIRMKTASLIAIACRLGAAHAGADDHLADRFERFGMSLGIAFQIQDDLLDLTGDERLVGKPLGQDAAKGKLTLPLIHHLATADPRARAATLDLLAHTADVSTPSTPASPASGIGTSAATAVASASAHADTLAPERGRLLAAAMNATGSVQYARAAAAHAVAQAQNELAPLHDSPAKRLLLALADAVVSRAY